MRIEAVTVCLHYDDFLEQTIRVNQSLFDDWVVVTSQADAGTIAVCQRYGVRTAFCPYFKHRGEQFAKAAAINIGLAHLKIGIGSSTWMPIPRCRGTRASTWRTWSWTLRVSMGSTGSSARLWPPGKTGW